MPDVQWSALPVFLAVLTATSVLSQMEVKNVPRGSNVTDCGMKCPHPKGFLALYRECGGEEQRLLDLSCDDLIYTKNYDLRLHLNTSSGCWTLTDAGTDDCCVYNVVYYGNDKALLKTLSITVLDPGSFPSTSSSGGFSTLHWLPCLLAAVAIVIALLAILMVFLVKRRNHRKTKKLEEVEMTVNNMGEHGRPTSSSSERGTDNHRHIQTTSDEQEAMRPPNPSSTLEGSAYSKESGDRCRDQGQKTQERNLPTRVLSTGNDLTYEEIPQRDEEAGRADGI